MKNWYAGNLHCHSNLSDGDTEPKKVAKWYRDHGYSFLSLTDHNCLTPVEEYSLGNEDFIAISGSEYTWKGEGVQTHVNGFGLKEKIPLPTEEVSLIESLQYGIDGVNHQGGIAMVNHPCWLWSFGSKQMKELRGSQLFELYNGAPTSNNDGDARHESTDEIWDALLSDGIEIFGVASDDAHHYQDICISPKGFRDTPGSGWVWVQAEELSQESILNALRNGDFIASNGVKLSNLERSSERMTIEIDPQDDTISYKTTFIGKEGTVLLEHEGLKASYEIRGDESYVRAKIKSSSGTYGWVQPIFIG